MDKNGYCVQVSPSLTKIVKQTSLPPKKKSNNIAYSEFQYDAQAYVMQLHNAWVDAYKKEIFGWRDLSKILGLSKNQVFALYKRDDFPQQTLGGRKVVTAIALSQWLANL